MGSRGRPRAKAHRVAEPPPGVDTPRAPGERRVGGRAERRRIQRRIKRRRRRSAVKEIPILVGVALVIALVLKTFLVQAFVIPSGSMEQTIRIGDRVLVDKFTPWFGSKPERGDVVVFKDPGGWLDDERKSPKDDPPVIKQGKEFLTFIGLLPSSDEQDLIKRVVAVGGDTVACCDTNGKVTVNGTPLNEPYLHPGNPPSQRQFKVTVPQGRMFVMGDHRSNSADSRVHLDEPYQGTVPDNMVVGRAVVIAWPFGHMRRLEEPDTYASVKDAPSGATQAEGAAHRLSPMDQQGMVQLPTPAELPLVMGVVILRRSWGRRQSGVRSGCGGFGGRRTIRSRRAREAARDDGRAPHGRDGRGARSRCTHGQGGCPPQGVGPTRSRWRAGSLRSPGRTRRR
ncbi:signal peptidase I [Streptomyces sp. 4503]|uniref:Signal peptidase I n=1 Tax=Streptomyces niphimycinicus TaxID=2842201 RepID=A0ABS6CTI8_9ACTN|nr:signal peptidase I [Streptomyces niphimycinicus]MBU3870277.1 signal peptidase I [Streptomyces niphimycinicus]